MLTRSILVTFLLVLAVAAAIAGPLADKGADKPEIKADQQFIKQTQKSLDELNRAIDLWHDANLKGSEKKITLAHEKIQEILRADITASWDRIGDSELEVFESAEELKAISETRAARPDDRVDIRDDIKDLKQAKIIVKTKEQLYASIEKSTAFSNKYRLLGDYTDLLKHQLGISRIELAEDKASPDEDRQPSFKR